MRSFTGTALLVAMLFFAAPVAASTPFSFSYNHGFGSLPTITFNNSSAITKQQAEAAFNSIKNESGIEWGHVYSNCEKRAHASSLILLNKGITHFKIWNFSGHYISLFQKKEQPSAPDKTGINPRVGWGYHVAIAVLVNNSAIVDTMVIDPAFSDKLISHKEWLMLQQAPRSFYTFTDPEWYTFNTLNGLSYSIDSVTTFSIPGKFQSLLTGDFAVNDSLSFSFKGRWIEEGLAQNTIAIELLNEIVKKEPKGSAKQLYFKNIISSIYALQAFINGASTNTEYPTDAANYKKRFESYRSTWIAKLDNLRKKPYPTHNLAPEPPLIGKPKVFDATNDVQLKGAPAKYEQNHN